MKDGYALERVQQGCAVSRVLSYFWLDLVRRVEAQIPLRCLELFITVEPGDSEHLLMLYYWCYIPALALLRNVKQYSRDIQKEKPVYKNWKRSLPLSSTSQFLGRPGANEVICTYRTNSQWHFSFTKYILTQENLQGRLSFSSQEWLPWEMVTIKAKEVYARCGTTSYHRPVDDSAIVNVLKGWWKGAQSGSQLRRWEWILSYSPELPLKQPV